MADRRPRRMGLKAAVAALEKAGKEVVRVEIEGGKLVIVTSSPKPGAPGPGEEINEWDSAGVSA